MRYSIKLCLLLLWIGFSCKAQEIKLTSVEFAGIEKSKVNYLKKLVSQKSGDIFNQAKVDNDLIVLIREPAVSHAFTILDTLTPGQYRLTYHLEENKTLIPAVDLWQGVNKTFAYHLGVTEYNFLGKGYILGGFYRKII